MLFVRGGGTSEYFEKGRGSIPLLHMPGLHDVITIHSSHLHSNDILYWQLKCATSDEIFSLKVSQVMQLLVTSGRMLRALFRATSQSCCFSCYSCVLSPCWDPTENWLCLQAFHSFSECLCVRVTGWNSSIATHFLLWNWVNTQPETKRARVRERRERKARQRERERERDLRLSLWGILLVLHHQLHSENHGHKNQRVLGCAAVRCDWVDQR